ncbi:MAG: metallophosphoesterase [Nitrospirae bacterium]|nr:metallophosphoesterase [Nitrospirota bacterium]
MSDIRYVCLSDMHLGDTGSILTAIQTGTTKVNPDRASQCLESLVKCLRDVISKNSNKSPKPALILNGDTLEMALQTTDVAATVFKRFIELIFGNDPLFGRIILIPGNHDHHIWETARETQYVEFIKKMNVKCNDDLKEQWHGTNMLDGKIDPKVESYLLKNVIVDCIKDSPDAKDFSIEIVYPNFAISKGSKIVVFHHGHFIESIYKLISILKRIVFPCQPFPNTAWDLEAENFAWIDFVWSSLGQSGKAGTDVGYVYKSMGDMDRFKERLQPVAGEIMKMLHMPALLEGGLAMLLNHLIDGLIDKITSERKFNEANLSDGARKGLIDYLVMQVFSQINREAVPMPTDIKFIFGHTHSPFMENMDVTSSKYKDNCPKDYPSNYPTKFDLYNTGGWVVDTFKPERTHGGAVVFIDDEFNAASLKMYDEINFKVIPGGTSDNPLIKKLSDIVTAGGLCKEFSDIAKTEVEVRRQVLKQLTK